jgi:hypothetical protein
VKPFHWQAGVKQTGWPAHMHAALPPWWLNRVQYSGWHLHALAVCCGAW